MWFLIKGTFYCTATLVALSFLAAPPAEVKDGASFDMGAAITAASGAYEYVTSLCVEKPEVCEKGKATFQALGQRAREGALVAYQLLDQQFTDEGTAVVADEIQAPKTGAVEIIRPQVETPRLVSVDTEAPVITGTVTPAERPRHLPKPYQPPKP
ncbi:hypothetical protein QWE_16153 [Agrobacterium albertimagni AOL15]|uniref:DUF5330 domain-containing protein n=1 Tax=Agrobacterium albertimagni AOL15 TaxID=1156935 RepID=K2QAS4_9HYPH|nr:DUF5330 domain-containing protein [Agrobacterium albertimagni]EKF58151.1 hypothetical protein QWE_16153 [Agrobacterium albertimagni AOL15]